VQLHADVGVVLRGHFLQEIAAHDDDAGIGVELDPVPGALVGTEDQLEVAVRVDVELLVVEVGEDRPVDPPCRVATMDRERDVHLTVALSRHAVRTIAANERLVVDRVGIVAEELARRRDDRREPRSFRVAFEEELGALGEQVEDVAESFDRVQLVEVALFVEHVVVADVREQPDELVERLGRLMGHGHLASRQIAVV
jgi:hypothetical protein